MSTEEEEEIIGFLKEISNNTPASIPTLPKRASAPKIFSSIENPPTRRSSTCSASRGRHSAAYDTQNPSSSYAGGSFAPTHEMESAPIQSSDELGISHPAYAGPLPRAESPQPLNSALQKPGVQKPQKNVGFEESQKQITIDADHGNEKNTAQPGPQRYHIPIINGKELKQSKHIASWCVQNGDLEEASRLYDKLIDWCEKNKRYDRGYYKMRLQVGQIFFIRGDYGSSEDILSQLRDKQYTRAREDPKESDLASEIARWLALSQWRQGKYSDAQTTLDDCRMRLPHKNGNSPDLLSTLALVLASAGAFKRAWRLSVKAIDPKSFEAHNPDVSQEADTSSGRRSSCLLNHARISYAVGKLKDADETNRQALEDMKRRLGPNHFITLDASSFQAWLLVARNKTSQAAETAHRTLREMMERLGESHPSTLQTLETLVLVYRSEGRYSDAEETATYLLRKNEGVLGNRHPQTLKSKTILAEILLACGKWKEAEEKQTEVVKLEQARPTTDIDYIGLFSYKTTLANILRESGKWDAARTLSVHVLVEQLNKFGNEDDTDEAYQAETPENEYIPMARLYNLLASSKPIMRELRNLPSGLHNPLANLQPVKIYPSIIQSLHCLALCEQVRDDADLTCAGGILKMVRDIRVSSLGEDHRLTVNVQYDLGVNYRLRGKIPKSLETIEDVVKRRRDSLGSDHPDYLCAKHQEAVTLFRLDRWEQATEEQRRTLKAQEFLLGRTHPDTVLSRFTLGGIYHSLNRLGDADKLLDQVINEQRTRYGENHPVVLRSQARHALILLDRGHFQGAEAEQRVVVERRKEILPKGHSLTRSALNDLAQIIQAAGRAEEALDLYNDLVKSLPSQPKNMVGFEVRSNLGSCYFDLKNYEAAERIQREIYEELKEAREENSRRLIASTFNLALTLRQRTLTPGSQDQLKEACKLLEEAVYRAENALGRDHPQATELRATLCTWQQ